MLSLVSMTLCMRVVLSVVEDWSRMDIGLFFALAKQLSSFASSKASYMVIFPDKMNSWPCQFYCKASLFAEQYEEIEIMLYRTIWYII